MTDLPAPTPPADGAERGVSVINRSPSVDVDSVMIIASPVIDESRLRADPFVVIPATRPPLSQTLQPDRPGSLEQQRRYVSEADMKALWKQIGELQEEVAQGVRATRTHTDTHQQDLLYATRLLFRSETNYEEVRQIIFNIRAELNREKRIAADIARYRVLLILYHLLWIIVTVIGISLDDEFRALIPPTVSIMQLAWIPILAGVFGALLNGLIALHEHCTVRRDFDADHVAWYLTNPILGGMLGLVVFVFFVVTGSTLTNDLLTTPQTRIDQTSPMVIWLLAFIVGWQQNIIIQLLNRFLRSFLPSTQPPTPSPSANSQPTPPPAAPTPPPSTGAG